jgi:DNA-binding PadR family transcriptional regulator
MIKYASHVGSDRELAPGEWSVLALLSERPAHGWALAAVLAPEGEVGSVWSLGRPLVYRSLEILEKRGLIEPAGLEPSVRGPRRTVFRVTAEGRDALRRWLAEPVAHVHEIRSLLLLKLVLGERIGADLGPMLNAQRDLLADRAEALEARLAESTGAEQIMTRFRLETALAALRFVEGHRAAGT